jgi:hypothetical protein
MTPAELAAQWRQEAETFARYGDARMAGVCRMHAEALAGAMASVDDEVLDLAAAHRESGYSVERLRHMIAAGDLPNAGRRGAPRIRRGDLPKKARSSTFDAADAARQILAAPRRMA